MKRWWGMFWGGNVTKATLERNLILVGTKESAAHIGKTGCHGE